MTSGSRWCSRARSRRSGGRPTSRWRCPPAATPRPAAGPDRGRAARDAHRRDRGLPGRADGRARRARLPVRRAVVLGAPDPGGPDDHLPRAVGADARGARRGRVTPVSRRTLIACLGNIFLSDDGFGVEVARRLAREELPDGTTVTDYGIRG